MNTIYKYPLQITDRNVVEMPASARILSVQMQHGLPTLWALVDTSDKVRVNPCFAVVGTGNPIDFDVRRARFIGTVQERVFVWHIFEVDAIPEMRSDAASLCGLR